MGELIVSLYTTDIIENLILGIVEHGAFYAYQQIHSSYCSLE